VDPRFDAVRSARARAWVRAHAEVEMMERRKGSVTKAWFVLVVVLVLAMVMVIKLLLVRP